MLKFDNSISRGFRFESMFIFALSGFINAILALIFGAFVYFKNKERRINRIFGLMSFSIVLWGFSYGMWQLSKDKETALFWSRILSLGATFIPVLFLDWVLTLLNFQKEKRKILFFSYLLTFLFAIFSFSQFYVRNVEPELSFPWWPKPGILYHFYIFFGYFGLMGYGLNLLFKTYKTVLGYKREQIKYVLIGTLVGIGGGATNFLLWYGIPFPPLGTFFVPLYPFILGYAISRYRLMDIRLIISKGVVYLFSFILVTALALFLLFLNNKLVQPVPINIATSLILLVGILFFQPIFRFFEKFASKYFYYTFYSYQTVLTGLGRRLTQVLELDKLSSLIVSTLINTMKLDRTVILLREPGNGDYRIQKNIGFKEENGISLVKDNFLTIYLEKTQKPLVYEELTLITRDTIDKEEKGRLAILQENMKRIEAAICVPLFIEEKIMGMIVLGNKISGDSYSEQDIDLLTNLANQASVALQNAKLYSEVQGFSKKLEKEVEKATKELRKAYEELKTLDKAKSEFISIASHQLRTPLTAIKGYISMILEKTYGEIPEKTIKPLQNIAISNERLIKLVNDLLNISRIESGKIEMNRKEYPIEDIITSIIDELKNLAGQKNLYLKFEKPEKPLPKILIDQDKIRQTIMNLVDNAIRYTGKGGVTIKLKADDLKLKIAVCDTGEGMTKEEISNLFESFSRGTAGARSWTEGAGLGLYVAKRFVEMHRGKTWAESPGKGKGSTFYIELPFK